MKLELQTELTARDRKLLRMLLVLLIVVGFVMLGIHPLYRSYDFLREKKTQAEENRKINEKKVAEESELEQKKGQLMADAERMTTQYYPIMTSSEVDKLVTGIVLNEGLLSKNLSIQMPDEAVDMQPYTYSELNANTTDTDEEETDDLDSSNPFEAATVSVSVQGDKENLNRLIDTLAVNYPSIRVVSYTWDTVTNTSVGDNLSTSVTVSDGLTLSLQIYMYIGKGE